jgi:hypothetical protein
MSEPRMDDTVAEDQDMEDEGDYNEEQEYDEVFDEEDAEEAAEAVVKQLGDALWADISKAYAQQGAIQLTAASEPSREPLSPHPSSPSLSEEGDDEDTLANAIQLVLDLSTSQPSLHQVLSTTLVPQIQDEMLLDILTEIAETRTVTPELAQSLSCIVQSVADGGLYDTSRANAVQHGQVQPIEEHVSFLETL